MYIYIHGSAIQIYSKCTLGVILGHEYSNSLCYLVLLIITFSIHQKPRVAKGERKRKEKNKKHSSVILESKEVTLIRACV